MKPRVSVVTPTYNHERYIGLAIQSVLNQSYADWEMVIVDDGSTDGTCRVAESFADPRIKVIRQSHRGIAGLGATYNCALSAAEGDLVAILEGDDLWPADKLEVQVADFEDPNVVLSAGDHVQIDEAGAEIERPVRRSVSIDELENRPVGRASYLMLWPDMLTYTFPVTVVMRKDALIRAGGFIQPEYLTLVDLPTFLRMGLEGEWRIHDHVLGYWRRHPRSTTTSSLPAILHGAYRYCAEFVHAYRSRIAASDEELDRASLSWNFFEVQRLMALSVIAAGSGDFRRSRLAVIRALGYRVRLKTKLMLQMAALFAGCRINPEVAFKLAGRGGSVERVTFRGGEMMVGPDMDPREFQRFAFVDAETATRVH